MSDKTIDVIDRLAGITPGSGAEALRERRPITKEEAQASWSALFVPADASQFSLTERFAVAIFVALLHGQPDIASFYAERLAAETNGDALLKAVTAAAKAATAIGPYGHYPAGPLSAENADGPSYAVAGTEKALLGEPLSAVLEHAHLLVFHPRDASRQALVKLVEAGYSTTAIVTLSQLVAFLAFQIRVVAGLKVLTAA